MKKILSLFLFLTTSYSLISQTCLQNGITFNSQSEIDNFIIDYPNCTEILGDVNFYDLNITNLNGLSNIVSIGGRLSIEDCDNLTQLSGLDNLTHIGGVFVLEHNNSLSQLTGLESLTQVDGAFILITNQSLTDMSALSNLETLGNEFYMQNNNAITSLPTFSNLTSLVGELDLRNNHLLSNAGSFPALESIGGINIRNLPNEFLPLDISGFSNITTVNDKIHLLSCGVTSLDGFQQITTIQGRFDIELCPNLVSTSAMSNLTFVGGKIDIRSQQLEDVACLQNITTHNHGIEIRGNSLLSLSGLSNLTYVGTDLILGDLSLPNLEGLNNLTEVGRDFEITHNNQLINFSGLENLTEVSGLLKIKQNPLLNNMTGLNGLTSVGTFVIESNSGLINLAGLDNLTTIEEELEILDNIDLSDISAIANISLNSMDYLRIKNTLVSICNYESICNYLINGGSSEISNNLSGCNDEDDVFLQCLETKIEYDIFYDENQNQIQDADETCINYGNLSISPSPLVTYNLNNDCDNVVYLDIGNFIVGYDSAALSNWNLTTDSTQYYVSNFDPNFCDTVSFGFFPASFISNMQPAINCPWARCGTMQKFKTHAYNLGTTISSGILWLEIDSNFEDVQFIDVPDTIISPSLYGWFFEDMYPGLSMTRQIELGIPAPPNFPLGGLLNLNSVLPTVKSTPSQSSSISLLGISTTLGLMFGFVSSQSTSDQNPSRSSS